MARNKLDIDVVREIAMAFEGVEESTTYGAPSFKVGGKLMACPAINKSAEPNSLAVRISFEQRAELIASDPDIYYLTDHYVNYPAVLVRLNEIDRPSLMELLQRAWQFVSSTKKTTNQGQRRKRKN